MNLERVKRVNFLENTMLLYNGTAAMYSLWSDSKKQHNYTSDDDLWYLWEKYAQFAADRKNDASVQTTTQHQTMEWRYQNQLADYFRFLEKEMLVAQSKIDANDVSNLAAKLLSLFSAVMRAEECQDTTLIPYLFERLCNSMRDIMNSDMSYIAYERDGVFTSLATSSINRDMHNYVFDESDFMRIEHIWEKEEIKRDSEQLLAGTILRTGFWKRSIEEDESWFFHIITLRFKTAVLGREWLYIVLQYTDKDAGVRYSWESTSDSEKFWRPLSNEDLERTRNILFLRTLLTEALQKNLHILITSQRTCQYVRPISKADRLTILHLTDLHVKCKDEKSLDELFRSFPELTAPISHLGKKSFPVDLVVITGDIVQGQCAAGELEEHYLLADRLLRKLAWRLWQHWRQCQPGKSLPYLRSDWRKRIIIIPGNHDYAAMNELEVVSQKGMRSTGVGRPAQKEGGPMVKFAYYIQFIYRLLGIDTGLQIRNWLNSVYHYDQMGLNLLCLNTTAGAGPLRNNKVHIDRDFVQRVRQTENFDSGITICLAHHTPNYKADYAVDRYYTDKIKQAGQPDPIEEMKGYVEEFEKILDMPVERESAQIGTAVEILYGKLDRIGLSPDEDTFMTDVSYYKDHFRDMDDERCEAIRLAMKRDRNMQDADRANQDTSFKELIDIAKIRIVLGGHIHKTQTEVVRHYYEGPLFFTSDILDTFQYGVLSIDCNKGTHDWLLTKYNNKAYEIVEPLSAYNVSNSVIGDDVAPTTDEK